MSRYYSLIIRINILALCAFFLCCCGTSRMPQGTCKPNGDLSIGAEKLGIQNKNAIIKIVQNKSITSLEKLKKYLETPTHGRGKENGKRYDIWHYTMYSTDLQRNNFCLLAVESTNKNICRMAYMTSSESQTPAYYGDAALAHALSQVTFGNGTITGLQNAFKQVEKRRQPLVKKYHKLKPAKRIPRQIASPAATPINTLSTQTNTPKSSRGYTAYTNSNGDLEAGASFLSWNNRSTINKMIKNHQFNTIQNIENTLGSKAHAKGSGKDGQYSIWHYNWSSSDLLHHWTCLLYAHHQGNQTLSVVYHAVLEDGKNRFYGDKSLSSKIENVQANWNTSAGNAQYPGLHKASHVASDQSISVVIPYIQRRGEEIKTAQRNQGPSIGTILAESLITGVTHALTNTYTPQSTPVSSSSSSSSSLSGTSNYGTHTVTTTSDCTRCHGRGSINNPYTDGSVTCSSCNGSGRVTASTRVGRSSSLTPNRTQCSLCNGQKMYDGKRCPSCLGKGYQESFFH